MSPIVRPCGDGEATVQTSLGGYELSTPEGGTKYLVARLAKTHFNKCTFVKYERPAQMEHATHTQEESERALNERILKLEGRRIQLEEV